MIHIINLVLVHKVQQGNGVHCFAAFFILNSPIRALHFVNSGDRFAVGYENGQVYLCTRCFVLFLFFFTLFIIIFGSMEMPSF